MIELSSPLLFCYPSDTKQLEAATSAPTPTRSTSCSGIERLLTIIDMRMATLLGALSSALGEDQLTADKDVQQRRRQLRDATILLTRLLGVLFAILGALNGAHKQRREQQTDFEQHCIDMNATHTRAIFASLSTVCTATGRVDKLTTPLLPIPLLATPLVPKLQRFAALKPPPTLDKPSLPPRLTLLMLMQVKAFVYEALTPLSRLNVHVLTNCVALLVARLDYQLGVLTT